MNISRRILLILTSFLFFNSLNAQWSQTNGPKGGHVYFLEEIDNVIWAGTEGGVYHSHDEGLTWQLKDMIPIEDSATGILYQDGIIYIAAARKREASSSYQEYRLVKSEDNGDTWVDFDLPYLSGTISQSVELFKNDTHLFYNVHASTYSSTDEGQTWTDIEMPAISTYFTNSGDSLFCAYGVIYFSENAGITWDTIFNEGLSGEMLVNDNIILLSDYDEMLVSDDRGENFVSVDAPDGASFYGPIFQMPTGRIYSLGSRVKYSDDGGFNWSVMGSNFEGYATSTVEIGQTILLATEKNIYRSVDGGNIWKLSHEGYIGSTVYRTFGAPNGDLYVTTNLGFFKSPNNGLSWFRINWDTNTNPQTYVRDMLFLEDKSFAVLGSYVLKITSDGIIDVTPETDTGTFGGAYDISYHEGRIFVTRGSNVYFTDDYGNSWMLLELNDGINSGLDDFRVVGDNYFYLYSSGEAYLKPISGGSTIQVINIWSPGAGHKNWVYEFDNKIIIPDDTDYWISEDGGYTWTDFEPITSVETSTSDDWPVRLAYYGGVLFGTISYNGLHTSTDFGQTWTPFIDESPNNRLRQVVYNNGRLIMGSSTGGVYKYDLDYSGVQGKVFLDTNFNNEQDPQESGAYNVLVRTEPDNISVNTRTDGSYELFITEDADSVTLQLPSSYFNAIPSAYPLDDLSIDYDFALQAIPDQHDLSIQMTNLEVFRPGFDNAVYLRVENVGTTSQNAIVEFQSTPYLNYISAFPAPTDIIDGTLIWDLGLIDIFEVENIVVQVETQVTAPLGDEIMLTATVDITDTDVNLVNNTAVLTETIVGSYDPNDKRVTPSGLYPINWLEDSIALNYTIRFQNTGTYLAENVRITDTLSPLLDISTLKIIQSSHPMQWFLRDEGALEFVFENIQLPDSTANEMDSHGFVKYSILPKSDLEVNEQIHNTAYIYFDFNAPIITNTVSNKIWEVKIGTAVDRKIFAESMTVFPNPASRYFNIKLNNPITESGKLSLINEAGLVVYQENKKAIDGKINVSLSDSIVQGYYQIIFTVDDVSYVGKLVLMK